MSSTATNKGERREGNEGSILLVIEVKVVLNVGLLFSREGLGLHEDGKVIQLLLRPGPVIVLVFTHRKEEEEVMVVSTVGHSIVGSSAY